MAQLVGASSHTQKFAGSIPGQDTYLGCRFDPWWGAYRRQLIGVCLSVSVSVSLSLSPSLPLSAPYSLPLSSSLSKINKKKQILGLKKNPKTRAVQNIDVMGGCQWDST